MILQKIQDATEAMVREREIWVKGSNKFVGGGSLALAQPLFLNYSKSRIHKIITLFIKLCIH